MKGNRHMKDKKFIWMVIGAGPAGIAAVGKLLDSGVSEKNIAWMDPYFQVGDLGAKWKNVSSNTKVDLFIRFLLDCKSFTYQERPKPFPIDHLDPDATCQLKYVAEPLQWITGRLQKRVTTYKDSAATLNLMGGNWEVKTDKHLYTAKNVILATGCVDKTLSHPELETIPLETALNYEKLKETVTAKDTVAVFGSSHSSMLILADLVKLKVKKIINFYKSTHFYAVDLGEWILFDNTGLKGAAAAWAKKNIDGTLPKNLKRILTTDLSFEENLSLCNKAIYSIGFQNRKLPILEQSEKMTYNNKTGIIAPGLFGFGIAFPEAKYDPLMNLEHRVGLWKFMEYLNTIIPIWLRYTN
ncbi:MAG: hypothetical protein SP4CHLAM5_08740 [Chlamydiia bacterium]|nr:hypothetical protein [Chlamydiia bacterium]MCH9618737.1 hypothetical protein [Chlamydiia bacterium]MCH9624523.1 hypothetical protein [Chlamydiia bacterium]